MATTTAKHNIFSIIILALFILLPLVRVTSLVDHTLASRQFLGSVGVGVLLVAIMLKGPKKPLPAGWVILSFLGFVILNFVSVGSAINPVESWATITRYLLMFSFMVSLLYMLHTKVVAANHLIRAVVVFGAIAGVITLFNLLQALASGEFFSDIYAVKGNFAHKNLLSSALMLALPFAIIGAATFKSIWQKASLALIFLLIIEVFVLRTRGVWLSVFIATFSATVLFFVLRKKSVEGVRFPFKLVGIGAGIAVLLLVMLFSATGVQESVSDTTNLDKRIVFWENSVEMIKEHPLTGVGAGNWKINFPKYGLEGLDYNVVQGITHVQRPHNDYLWVLSESGAAGFAFFLLFFVVVFARLASNFKNITSKEELATDIALVFGLLSYLVFSLTDFPLERTSHNFLLMVLVALVFRSGLPAFKLSLKGNGWAVLLLGGVVFSLTVSYYRMEGEKHSVKVLEANATRNAQAIIPEAEDAVNPFYNMDNFANPVYYYSSLGKLVLQRPQEALEDGLMAYDIAPYNIITLTQLGNVYKTQKNIDEAMRYYTLATDISPEYEIGHFSKAEMYLNDKRYVEAMRELWGINPRSKDPRLKKQLPYTMQQLYATRTQHGEFKGLMKFMDGKNLRTPDDYINLFDAFVKSGTKAKRAESL